MYQRVNRRAGWRTIISMNDNPGFERLVDQFARRIKSFQDDRMRCAGGARDGPLNAPRSIGARKTEEVARLVALNAANRQRDASALSTCMDAHAAGIR